MQQRLIYLTPYGDRMRVFGDVVGYSVEHGQRVVWVQPLTSSTSEGYPLDRLEVQVSA